MVTRMQNVMIFYLKKENNMGLIKLTKQELEICYILSRIFNYYTSYDEILGDIKYNVVSYQEHNSLFSHHAYLVNKKQCFALFRVKRKYKRVAEEILALKINFKVQDLDKLFCLTALYCLRHRFIIDITTWCIEKGWERDEFIRGITNIKKLSFFHKAYIHFKLKNHYKLLCFAFGFTHYSFRWQKKLLQRDKSIHSYDYFGRDLFMWWGISVIFCFLIGILKYFYKLCF